MAKKRENRVSDNSSETNQGGRPGSGSASASDPGINERSAQRAAKDDSLSGEDEESAKELGIDINHIALFAGASYDTVEGQVNFLKNYQEAKESHASTSTNASVNAFRLNGTELIQPSNNASGRTSAKRLEPLATPLNLIAGMGAM